MKISTHDSARGTESLGGEVGSELGLDSTRVTVRSRDSAPDDSDSATVDLPLGLVDVGDTLDNKSVIFSNGDTVTMGTVWYTILFPPPNVSLLTPSPQHYAHHCLSYALYNPKPIPFISHSVLATPHCALLEKPLTFPK